MPGDLDVDGLYERQGTRFVPGPLTAGPWDRRAQHGGAPTALVGRLLLDHEPGEEAWFLGRLTVELIRPVPVSPLDVRIEVARPGRRVQVLDAVVTDAAGTEVLWARGVRVSQRDNGLDEATVPGPPPPTFPAPEACAPIAFGLPIGWPSFGEAFELRQADGQPFVELGPAAVWSRLLIPVFAGDEIHPLDRALTLADFPNGFASSVPFDRYRYINPDLTVSLHRVPRDEWVLLDAVMHPRATGHGTAGGTLHDRLGPVGTCAQTLLISAR
jgi:hypothetical protein